MFSVWLGGDCNVLNVYFKEFANLRVLAKVLFFTTKYTIWRQYFDDLIPKNTPQS